MLEVEGPEIRARTDAAYTRLRTKDVVNNGGQYERRGERNTLIRYAALIFCDK
jgi:hypothetical protein